MAEKLLQLLRNISEVIAQADDNAVALSRVVDILADGLEVDVCSVYEHDIVNDRLVLLATHGLKQTAIGQVSMSVNEGLTGKSFRENCLINVANPSHEPEYKYFPDIGEENFKSFMAVPLVLAGTCVGVFTLQRTAAEPFSEQIVDVGRSLAPQLANLIINAEIFKSFASRADEQPKSRSNVKESFVMFGSSANSGFAQGQIFKYLANNRLEEMDHAVHNNAEAELKFFEKALNLARNNTIELEYKAISMISEADASIFNSHLLILEDKTVIDAIRREILSENHTLEFSIAVVYRQFKKKFESFNNQILRERLVDFKDAMLRLLESASFIREQRQQEFSFAASDGSWIIVASELLPSDLIRMPLDNITGIVCEKGGLTSHVAILAKAFSIPAIMGVKGIIERVNNYDTAIVDGCTGKVLINPGNEIELEYAQLLKEAANVDDEQIAEADPRIFTADHQEILCKANISLISETKLLKKYGANGIGLYRTEFMFMIRDYLPNEETQLDIFSKVVRNSNGTVTFRLLDAGGDKQIVSISTPQEENPALGLRGIRLLNSHPEMLNTHLRAILRAGQYGKIKIMLPMVSTLEEIRQFRQLLSATETALAAEGLPYSQDYELGIMLEVPAMVFDLTTVIKEIDFASIGSNDLFQFTFARDRSSDEQQNYLDYLEPTFIRVLADIGKNFSAYPEKELSICGEMVGNPLIIPLLIGAGIYSFSMPAKIIPEIRKIIRAFSVTECQTILQEALACSNLHEVATLANRALSDKNL